MNNMIEIKIPEMIKVGGLDYKIESSPGIDTEMRCNETWGEHNIWLQRIRIRTDVTPQAQGQVFLHEIIHAISEVYLNKKLTDDDGIIEPLSQGLTQVFEQLGIRFVVKEVKT